jgi:hypothetical protein
LRINKLRSEWYDATLTGDARYHWLEWRRSALDVTSNDNKVPSAINLN